MYTKKKFIMFVIFFAIIVNLFLMVNVKADSNDVNIISKSQVTVDQAKKWAKSRGATDLFINLVDLYFKYYPDHGNVNPTIAYVQSAKETNFGGVLDESFHNPCVLKKTANESDTDKNAHKVFNT